MRWAVQINITAPLAKILAGRSDRRTTMGEENAGSAIVPPPKNWWRDSSLVERLKRDADLVGMIRSHGVDLRAQGADLVGLCPFHQENTPSFRLDRKSTRLN